MQYLVWDFDGTLGYREGMWSAALLEVLDMKIPHHPYTREQIRPFLQSGFPWHDPEKPHCHLITPQQWWDELIPLFERIYTALGYENSPSEGVGSHYLARQVRPVYTNSQRFHLYEDTLPVLQSLSEQGWIHLLLSNHVPELRELLNVLGLGQHITTLFNSAETGYEKPHPQAFRSVLEYTGSGGPIWMIGDNYPVDIQGAAKMGISNGILVRKSHPEARMTCADLWQVLALLTSKER